MPITPFLQGQAFDPELMAATGKAHSTPRVRHWGFLIGVTEQMN